MSDNPRIAWAAQSHIRPGHLRLEALLQKLIEDGLLPNVPPMQLIYAIAAVCQAPFMLQHEIRQTHDVNAMTEGFIESYANTVLQLLLRG
jgi:TetR/AcrR family transcriptional regulator